MDLAVLILTVLIMIIGALGTILPAIPGTPMIFVAALGYGIYEGFHNVTITAIIILAVITILTIAIDYISGVIGAKKYGASRHGVWGAVIGGIIGIFFGLIGLFIGPFIGAIVGELIAGKEIKQSVQVGFGSFMGLVGGSIIKFTFAIIMIIYFVYIVI